MKIRDMLNSLALLAAVASCSPDTGDPADIESAGQGTFIVSLEQSSSTRADSDTAIIGNEDAVTGAEVLIFDASGSLAGYKNLGTSLTGTLRCRIGDGYTVYAVLNAPSSMNLQSVKRLSALRAIDIALADGNVPSGSFVMAGFTPDVSLTAGETVPVTVPVSRLVARVSCLRVCNMLPPAYGPAVINDIFMTNVCGKMKIGETDCGRAWLNPMGRMSESPLVQSHIINGTTYASDAPELLYSGINASVATGSTYSSPRRFYCYPNSISADIHGFASTMTARHTRMVISATVSGRKYYYPVDMPVLAANTCYDVSVTLRNLGSDDPETPIALGDMDVTISVNGWETGSPIIENL